MNAVDWSSRFQQISILTQALSVGDLIRNTNKLREEGTDQGEAKANLLYTSLLMIFFELLFANLQNLYTYNFYLIGMKVPRFAYIPNSIRFISIQTDF